MDMKNLKHISAEVKEGDPLEDRIKEVEEKLENLNEKLDDLSDKIHNILDHASIPSPSEIPESPPSPAPVEYDYDDWYSNHGQGD